MCVVVVTENHCLARAWNFGHGRVKRNLREASCLDRAREHRGQPPGLPYPPGFCPRPWPVHLWRHPLRGDSLPIHRRGQEDGRCPQGAEHRPRYQSRQG